MSLLEQVGPQAWCIASILDDQSAVVELVQKGVRPNWSVGVEGGLTVLNELPHSPVALIVAQDCLFPSRYEDKRVRLEHLVNSPSVLVAKVPRSEDQFVNTLRVH